MKIDDIHDMWEHDSRINEKDLATESINTPTLHSKYLRLLSSKKLLLKKQEADLDVLLRDKWEYYNGKLTKDKMDEYGWSYDPFNGQTKPLKSDMDKVFNSDQDLINANLRIEHTKECVQALKEIVEHIKWRHQIIKNTIEYMKFVNGA